MAYFTTFALAALVSLSQGHMIMKTPVPYGHPNNSPLDPSGSDYPCKGGGAVTTMNTMPAGSSQMLSFTGSATHGGGSCQVSLTMDKTPSKSSLFKVIHSIEGGCPASASGNLGNDPNSSGTPKFNFTMPKDMPTGTYSLAWTWFNEVGNREMYMNCAPVTVTGGAPNADAFNKLPDMFVGNEVKAKNGAYDNSAATCVIKESTDLAFPEPGTSVQRIGSKQAKPPAACMPKGKSATVAAPKPDAAGAPKAGGADTSAASPAGPAAAPVATSAAAPVATPASTPASMPMAAAPAPAPVAAPASGGACPAGQQPCAGPGSMICIGTTQFGLCNANSCAIPQPLAAGTTCKNGAIAKRDVDESDEAAIFPEEGETAVPTPTVTMTKRSFHGHGNARHVHSRRRAMPGWGVGNVDDREVLSDDLIMD